MNIVPAVEEFEQIIRHQTAEELVPFLLALEKRDVVPVREKLKELRKELESVVQLSATSWGSRGTGEQYEALFLTGFAVYSRTDALRSLNNGWVLAGSNQQVKSGLHEAWLVLIKAIRPDWLGDWLQQIHRNSRDWAVSYTLLRTLEEEQLIPYWPETVVKAVVGTLSDWGRELSHGASVPPNAATVIADQFRADPVLLQRDLPLLFEFDTAVRAYSAHIQLIMPFDEKSVRDDSGAYSHPWQVWNQKHPPLRVTWQDIIIDLTATGHLDRANILTRCLLALRRDFRRPLLTWFKELFLALNPTTEERLARQTELLELLPHPQTLVANFALEQLKNPLSEPDFSPALLLPYTDGLFLRADLKTALRTLLAALLKLVKQDAAHAPAVALLCAAALPHPDSLVQERAAKGLAGLLQMPSPLLNAEETAAALAAINRHADLLAAPARTALAAWLATAGPADMPAETATYAPAAAPFVPELSAATAIVPVADWHELLFLTGQVLRHDDPAAAERWLDGLLRLNGQWPAGFAGQLRPYLAQLFPEIKKASEAEVAAILREPVDVYGHEGLAQALLLAWATDFAVARVAAADLKRPHAVPHPLLTIEKQRYRLAESLLRARQALPLLSTPTHQPHVVAPSVLVARLLTYQAAGVSPDAADLAVALARTAHAHPASAAEALAQLLKLANTELRELLTWFLTPADTVVTALPPAAHARTPANMQAPLAEALPELWAVAARTKVPAGHFPMLPAALGYDYPGVAQPLHSAFEVVPHENRYDDPDQPGQTKSFRFVELAWDSGAVAAAPSPLLLYAPPVGRSDNGSWEENLVMADDLRFLLALIPQHPAPLYDQVLRTAAWADNLEVSERNLVLLALRALLVPGPALSAAETGLLACGLLHHVAECRRLAQEALLRAIAGGRLLPARLGETLARQLAVGYAPVPRLTDGLAALTGLDALTDDALTQLLEALLPELPPAPPRNTGRMLEAYATVRLRTARPVPVAVRGRLSEWQAVSSLKKAATALLN